MICYNQTWVNNLLLINEIEKGHKDGIIPNNELENIKREYPVGFYTPTLFIRIGLFVLTIVISLFSSALLSVIMMEAKIIDSYGWLIFLGILHYIVLEVVVRDKNHYRSGVDDALLWISGTFWAVALFWAFSKDNTANYMGVSAILCLLSLFLTNRFYDMLMSLIAYLSCFAFVFFAWQKVGSFGTAAMPFILLFFSLAFYMVVKRNLTNVKVLFYRNCMTVLQVISLITLYLSCNYYVVKELGDMLNGIVSKSIPLSWFFWLWTIILPIGYIAFGIFKKDVVRLRTGLLLVVMAALTFRNYYYLLPIELTLTICGVVLLAISYYLIRYLNTPKHGFTYQEPKNPDLMDKAKIESLIISESFSESPVSPTNTDSIFGGGHFGGGGANSGF